MRRVFNDGVGLAIVVAENDVDEAIAILKERGEDACIWAKWSPMNLPIPIWNPRR